MRAGSRTEADLVTAAQAGDRQAVDELVTAYLPLVYNLVGRALSGRVDVDDVVQEIMFRALRDLPALRTPKSFRSWLLVIAVRQVGTFRQQHDTIVARTTTLDDAANLEDAEAEFEELTILRLGLSGQRRQLVRASWWLDPDNRTLLSLWWLEVVGRLTRTELAAATGMSVAHAGVRVQRMREQLELSRALVAALETGRRCAGLDDLVADWDGRPGPLWRKRIARHTRSCTRCARASAELVPAERLLIGLALVPVPAALAVAVVGGGGSAGASGTAALHGAAVPADWLGRFAHAVAIHPILAVVVSGGLVVGAAIGVTMSPPRPAVVAAAPAVPEVQSPGGAGRSNAATQSVPLGPLSLEAANAPGRFVAVAADGAALARIEVDGPESVRSAATFDVVAGLAGTGCISLRTRDGRYVRHASWRLRAAGDDGTTLFEGDATFCPRPGDAPGATSFESSNYPGWFLRHVGDELWVDQSDGSAAFRADSSFHIRAALAE